MTFIIRPVKDSDLESITDIYGYNVVNGTGSFELEPPSIEDMTKRIDLTLKNQLPYLVIEQNQRVLGFCYAGYFHHRAGYKWTLEDSIYLHKEAQGQGFGKLLLNQLIDECIALGFRQMVSIIGGSDNVSSIALHKACGFEMIGVLNGVGRKHDKWCDSVYMQRTLGEGSDSAPVEGFNSSA